MDKKRKMTYFLAVSKPDSNADWLFQAETETPFTAMHEGDLFHMDSVEGFAASNISGRIGRVEHSFYAVTTTTLVQRTRVYLKSDDWHKTGKVY